MKTLIKFILRKVGLLKWVRKLIYKTKYRILIRQLDDPNIFRLSYEDIEVSFSTRDPFSASFFAYYLKDKIYEEEALKIILKSVKENGIFADVGANIGYFTCLAGAKAKQVFAFELGDENCRILRENIGLNKLENVVVEHCAVSDFTGTLYHTDSAVGNAVLKIIENNDLNNPDIIPIQSLSLDEYFAAINVVPTIVKIDVEGAEMKVLNGMKRLLKDNLILLIEVHPKDLLQFGSSEQEVKQLLTDSGYSWNIVNNGDKKNNLLFAQRI